MKIVNDPSGDYSDGPTVKINLTRFSQDESDKVLFYGYNTMFNKGIRNHFANYKSKLLLNLWMPTEFNCDAPISDANTDYQPDGNYTKYFDRIYSICPYTIQWLRDVAGDTRYRYIWHPFASPNDYGGYPLNYTKKYDVCYFGGIHGKYHQDMAKVLKEYNSRISYIYPNEYTTDVNLSHHEKMQMVANTKISIVFNQCPLTQAHISSIKRYKDWEKNEAFQGVDLPVPIIPQYKCRTAEAAYGRSVILVQRDRWNIIEDFFGEDQFVYFDDIPDMKKKIDQILANYDEYQPMLDRAFDNCLEMDGEGTLATINQMESEECYTSPN
jgi:hypothetical protein